MPRHTPPTFPAGAGQALVLAGALAVSFKSIFVSWAYDHGVDPATLLALRVWLVLPLLAATCVAIEGTAALRTEPRDLLRLALAGACFGTAMLLSFFAIGMLGAALATLVTFTYPAWTVALGALANRTPVGRGTAAALALTFVGMALVVSPRLGELGTAPLLGCGVALTAALAFASQNIVAERLVRRVEPVRVLTLSMAFVALATIPWLDPDTLPRSGRAWGAVAGLAIVSGYVPFLTFTYGLRHIGAGPTSILTTVSPPLTVGWAALLLGERLTAAQLAGTAVLLAGVGLVRAQPRSDAEGTETVEPIELAGAAEPPVSAA